ncbi:O-antigen ligase family protein [Kineobactrum salinum]|uniref:Glycosyltransferase n=1 Tax=Kineobactrum salinum TaxID=2708301 RepID=A0A6C0U049_9GAMM|nr:O-antigen ligase family protein [Kineobactrum salinum]QIB65386.1 glycosyltransferase [Kineobactrum salinum]
MIPSPRGRQLLVGLAVAGFAGSLVYSSLLTAAVFLLAGAACLPSLRRLLTATGWGRPRELRLLHFACWFPVLVYVLFWAHSGFDYHALKELDGPARLLLFWPLVLALSWSGLGARELFHGFALMALGAALHTGVSLYLASPPLGQPLRTGLWINPITLGNLALLAATVMLSAAICWWRQQQLCRVWLALGLAGLALGAALLTQTRSNLLALPLLFAVLSLQLSGRQRFLVLLAGGLLLVLAVAGSHRILGTLNGLQLGELDVQMTARLAVWDIAWTQFANDPWTGSGLTGYRDAVQAAVAAGALAQPEFVLDCCASHAHNDLLQSLATRGVVGGLSWLMLIVIPLTVFARYLGSAEPKVAFVASVGVLLPVGYAVFGLTEAVFSRTLFVTFFLLTLAACGAALVLELQAACRRPRAVSVSAIVITRDEEEHIGDCLASVAAVADEIIVLDSGSADATVAIARQHTDKIVETDWPGFGIQKQRALERATGDWVLSIDADERVSPALAAEINHVLAAPDADAYRLPWAVTIYGSRLDFGRSGRAPLRLFRRDGVRFSDAMVHEKILLPEGRRVHTLRGRLVHFTHRDFGHALQKGAQYAWLGACEKHRQGKRVRSLIYPTVRGMLTFVQVYLLRLGFLDGQVGFLSAVLYAQVSFNKYAGLWTRDRPRYAAD